jgi:hypothetical protein
VGEIGRQGWRAMHGDGVTLLRRHLVGVQRQPDGEGEGATDKNSNTQAASRNSTPI